METGMGSNWSAPKLRYLNGPKSVKTGGIDDPIERTAKSGGGGTISYNYVAPPPVPS